VTALQSQTARSGWLWFGLLGAPAAWGVQHWVAVSLAIAGCSRPGAGTSLPLRGLAAGAAVVAATIALAALAASIAVFRATRDASDEPPESRVHFLATIGMTISPLLLCIILMDGFGSALLDRCHQG
jgi:hypothetical protein